MKFKRRSEAPLLKRARRGFRGYPIATVAFYGPDDHHASKVAVSIITAEGGTPSAIQRWTTGDGDARRDPPIAGELLAFVQQRDVRSVAMTERIIGCPHEEVWTIPRAWCAPAVHSGPTVIAGPVGSSDDHTAPAHSRCGAGRPTVSGTYERLTADG
jgi:hypothetical protein